MYIASAYRMVPVHPGDRSLLAVQWAGKIFFDTRLQFGLCLARKIFMAVADALQWIFRKWGVTWVAYYLDDYITIGSPRPRACKQNFEVMLSCCQRLGVPVSVEKCAGPSSKIVFLGFELDTISMVVRLPEEKMQRIKLLVQKWMGRRACRKRDLESLLGHLQHAASVICPGRTFVRRLIEGLSALAHRSTSDPDPIYINPVRTRIHVEAIAIRSRST